MIDAILLAFGLGVISSSPSLVATDSPAGETATAVMRREAKSLEPLVKSRVARDFLKATADLPAIAPRRLFLDQAKKTI